LELTGWLLERCFPGIKLTNTLLSWQIFRPWYSHYALDFRCQKTLGGG
jgi:hypothetical protein